jgi:erythromycin esterase
MISADPPAELDSYLSSIGSTAPGASHDDLKDVLAHADEADIVGLGEGTHGTREFFELKDRLVRALVTQCGFRTIAFETDFAATLSLDAFVQHGTGTPADALDDIALWVWRTAAIRSFLEWLRAFNDGRPPEDRVRLHGISLSNPATPATKLHAYLDSAGRPVPQDDDIDVASDQLPALSHEGHNVVDVLAVIADREIPADTDDRDAILDAGVAVAKTLTQHLEDARADYLETWSTREWTVAHHLCRHLEQTCAWNQLRLSTPGRFDPDAFERRDRYMAENVSWCLETDSGNGVLVWAHNAHVQRGSFDMAHDWAAGTAMGEFLARNHGDSYRPYASTFARGSYRAVPDVEETDERQPRAFTAAEPPPDAVVHAVTGTGESESSAPVSPTAATHDDSRAGSTRFFDIAGARTDRRLRDWVADERRLRAVPALVDPDADAERRYAQTDIAASFDGLFVVPESSPSRPIDTTD